jgi:GNAT superfamily N-acetyltransferase
MVGVERIEIRDATDGDAAALAQLLGELGYPSSEGAIPDRIARMRAEPGQHVLVASAGDRVIGLATLVVRHVIVNDAPFARLAALVVTEDQRGHGVGQALAERAEQIAREAGCNIVEVTSAVWREGAHEFYRQLGYQERPRRFTKLL